MDKETIIIGAVALIVVLTVVRYITKKAFKILLALIVLFAAGLFSYIYLTGIHTVAGLEERYCEDLSDIKDSLKCVCIVQPVSEDFHERFSDEELENMNEITFAKELSKALFNKRKIINEKLKENNALHLLKEFKDDILKTEKDE
ncbi:MAG: hypothetical protein GXO50_09625 [Chlorobi bacterium]|nr:hypothetical protein [Chlorobiota bacterium]